jgi:hypothetical protein
LLMLAVTVAQCGAGGWVSGTPIPTYPAIPYIRELMTRCYLHKTIRLLRKTYRIGAWFVVFLIPAGQRFISDYRQDQSVLCAQEIQEVPVGSAEITSKGPWE